MYLSVLLRVEQWPQSTPGESPWHHERIRTLLGKGKALEPLLAMAKTLQSLG
jgi:hypothetical protein